MNYDAWLTETPEDKFRRLNKRYEFSTCKQCGDTIYLGQDYNEILNEDFCSEHCAKEFISQSFTAAQMIEVANVADVDAVYDELVSFCTAERGDE